MKGQASEPTANGRRELFVYYRVRAVDRAAAAAVVRRFQFILMSRHLALLARLLVRPALAAPAANAEETWMETYAIDPAYRVDGIDAQLQAEIEAEARGLAPWLRGPRHVEVFSPLA